MIYQLKKSDPTIVGDLTLDGSKSISNRVLLIHALCQDEFNIDRLSTSKDTTTLQKLLQLEGDTYDAGAAGTTFRFMTAYLALQPRTQILTGSDRMKQRPVGVLVEALNELGADIGYLEKTGYPPLSIGPGNFGTVNELRIPANISSQFISALLMIAPVLPNGLTLHLEGEIVSRPYIQMTLSLMSCFEVDAKWEGQTINVKKQAYQPKNYTVEADWSAASYYYAMAAFSQNLNLHLKGLCKNSIQGDSVLTEIMTQFGIDTEFVEDGVVLTKGKPSSVDSFQWNFIKCPDIAQTLAVVCGGLGVEGFFTGLRTLKIKETDRVQALQNELKKVKVDFSEKETQKGVSCQVKGKAHLEHPTFATYEDHRMAMAFAPFAIFGTIKIEEPMVVVKSYPKFYEDLGKLGFTVESV